MVAELLIQKAYESKAGWYYILNLGHGFTVRYSVEDYAIVNKYSWWICRGYARARVNGKRVYMHKLIADPHGRYVVHHRNGNRLDNRRVNLVRMKEYTHKTKYNGMGK